MTSESKTTTVLEAVRTAEDAAGVAQAAAPAATAAGTQPDAASPPASPAGQTTPSTTPAAKPTAKPAGNPPRLPRYITRRRPDNLLMYVRRIPADIQASGLYPRPRATIRVCLGTRDWLAAQPRANQLTAQLEALWAQTRKQQATHAGPAVADRRRLRADDVAILAKRLEANLLHSDDLDREQRLSDAEYDEYEATLEEQRRQLRRAAQRADLDAVRDEAAGILETEGLECDERSPEWTAWLKAVLQAHLSALGSIAQRLDCHSIPTPKAPPPVRSEDDLDDLDQALTYWQAKTAPRPKTVVEMRAAVERFKSTTGRSRISAVTAEDVVAFLRAEQSRKSARGGTVNPQTANKALALLKALFSVVHDDYLKNYGVANPLADIRKFRVKAKDRGQRLAFTREQLETLFSGPVHTAGARPAGGAGEAAYWIPVLGYATGARLQELAQLRTADVVEQDGVVLLHITTLEDEDAGELEGERPNVQRSLKTSQSYRLIPLHRDVLALGFMDYVTWLRECGQRQLFPEVRPGAHESWSANMSKFFNRYLRQLGLKRRLLDFVSLRHGFKSQTRDVAGMQQDIADYIQGHAARRASQGYGEFSARALHEAINLMSFPALACCKRWHAPRRRSALRDRGAAPQEA
ncbi:MAG: hypothetical protein HXY24_08855 [Rubrivivax sp.]|nr:hypothetical protein [Rubrivivax sp.]